MKLLNIFVIILFAIVAGICFTKIQAQILQKSSIRTTISNPLVGIYAGTFPCGDCVGLFIKLELSAGSETTTSGQYTLEEIYEGELKEPIRSTGTWQIIYGTPFDPHAEVVKLSSKTNGITYYLVQDFNTLKYLDTNRKEIQSPGNLVLKRI